MFGEKSLLAIAFEQQECVEKKRLKLREAEKDHEASKKELAKMIVELKEKLLLEDSTYFLESTVEEGKSQVNKLRFLDAFGQEKFNEAAEITVGNAENAVGKTSLIQAPGVISKKQVFKDTIIKK